MDNEEISAIWLIFGLFCASRKKNIRVSNLQLENVGLLDSDIDEKIDSVNDLVNYIASSGRLFRISMKHLLLTDIQLYFNNPRIKITDNLMDYFPKRGIRFEWVKFSNYFALVELKVPKLKVTRITTGILSIYSIGLIYFLYLVLFSQIDLIIHMSLNKIALIPFLLSLGTFLGFGIYLLGELRLPAKTFDDLAEDIIRKNLTQLLTDDKKPLKELLLKQFQTV